MTKKTVLLADNDPEFARTREEFLENEGFEVVLAGDPLDAELALREGGIGVAVLDIRLRDDNDPSDTSGLTLARRVAPSTPKIMLTGFPTVDAARDALAPGADSAPVAVDFIAKEEGPEVLVSAVTKAFLRAAPAPTTRTDGRSTVRLAGGMLAIIALLAAMGAGVLAAASGDARWLLATMFLAMLMVLGTGLAVFLAQSE